ncbi:MAG: mandelate racemase/muconate lactonizing enzyme family protein [Gammaproteobacteria bacterium]|nr:mandelate racemase/muconate lactonizing enzyme family protein [Gammaproteobacteria bacterium]
MNKRQFLAGTGSALTAGTLGVWPWAAFTQAAGGSIARVSATAVNVPGRLDIGPVQRDVTLGGTVVEVETADGLSGHGFTSITNSEIVAAAVNQVIAPAILGEDAMAREGVAEQLYWLLTPRGQTGHAVHATSAVDLALWDILGKRFEQPVWRLLGAARDSVPTYTTFGMAYLDRDELAEAARYLVSIGQHRLKMVVAAGAYQRLSAGESIEEILNEDRERIRAVREAAGSDAEIYIDANHGLDEYHARRFIRQIADYDIAFFEEPLRGNDIRRLADLRLQSPIPIAAGQNEGHIRRWRDMVAENAVDVLQLNVCIGGGYTNGLKIAALGHAFGVPIDNGGAWPRFNMHLHAGVANGGMAEWHMGAVALERELYRESIELTGDRLMLPERPGVGFELDRDVLRDSAVPAV